MIPKNDTLKIYQKEKIKNDDIHLKQILKNGNTKMITKFITFKK